MFELGAANRRIAHIRALVFAHHKLSSVEQLNNQSTYIYRSGVTKQHIPCWSSVLLQAHPTVAFVCLKSFFLGCVFMGSSESEPTSVRQLGADTHLI